MLPQPVPPVPTPGSGLSLPGTASFPLEPVEKGHQPSPTALPGAARGGVSALGREGYSEGEIKCVTAELCGPSW